MMAAGGCKSEKCSDGKKELERASWANQRFTPTAEAEIWAKTALGKTLRMHRCFTCIEKEFKEENQTREKEILVPDVSLALQNLLLMGNKMNSPCNWKWHFSDSLVLTVQPQTNAITSQISISSRSNNYFRGKKSYTSDG